MSLYKNASRPDCMGRSEGSLEKEEIATTVCALSYEGLQMAAALGLTLSKTLGITPNEVEGMLSEMLEDKTA
jgi:hypothetical protein